MRKSKGMIAVEERFGEPLETLLPRVYAERGHVGTAEYLGVPIGTLNYWILNLGFRHEHRLVPMKNTENITSNVTRDY